MGNTLSSKQQLPPKTVVPRDEKSLYYQGGVPEKRKRLAAIRSLAKVPVTVMPLGQSLGGLRSFDALEHLAKVLRGKGGAG